MNEAAKIRLSPLEAELVKNSDWILTKNRVMQKARLLMEQIQAGQQDLITRHRGNWPPEALAMGPKISRGENYLGLPYVVLDFPRHFRPGNHFAIRTMFWWGNFFSLTLHLSGGFRNLYAEAISRRFTELREEGYFICVNDDEWQHHFNADNYVPVANLAQGAFTDLLVKRPFVKLASKLSLDSWDSAGEQLLGGFEKLLNKLWG